MRIQIEIAMWPGTGTDLKGHCRFGGVLSNRVLSAWWITLVSRCGSLRNSVVTRCYSRPKQRILEYPIKVVPSISLSLYYGTSHAAADLFNMAMSLLNIVPLGTCRLRHHGIT